MATGNIHHSPQLGYCASSHIMIGLPAYAEHQYLHKDGQWHSTPKHDHWTYSEQDNGKEEWPGYWEKEEDARSALEQALSPTHYIEWPDIPACRECNTVAFEGLQEHRCTAEGLRQAQLLKEIFRRRSPDTI